MSIAESIIWFISGVWEAAFPFLLLAAGTSALVAVHDGIERFVERGLRRRRARLAGDRS
ncbi:MAG: hypothetical protein WDA03_08440 [Trueperaceae bacterium]